MFLFVPRELYKQVALKSTCDLTHAYYMDTKRYIYQPFRTDCFQGEGFVYTITQTTASAGKIDLPLTPNI
jgi:hypothetical protein